MTTAETKRLLTNGATIEKGAFSGHWLRTRDGKRIRLAAAQARELLPICTRIDDGKSRCGATWALCDCQDADIIALDALLRDYRHLEARGDDEVANEFRDGLVADAIAERNKLVDALRECVKAMQAAADGMGKMPHQTWRYLGMIPADLLAAAAKAREVLGE